MSAVLLCRHLVVTTLMISVVAVMLTACASGGGPAGGGSRDGTVAGAGSCAAASPPVHFSHARIVFIGTALTSPGQFRVVRYLKGSGPAVVRVQTALASRGNATVFSEDGIEPRAGQQWKIYTSSLHTPYETSLCDGSCVLSGIDDGTNIRCGDVPGA